MQLFPKTSDEWVRTWVMCLVIGTMVTVLVSLYGTFSPWSGALTLKARYLLPPLSLALAAARFVVRGRLRTWSEVLAVLALFVWGSKPLLIR